MILFPLLSRLVLLLPWTSPVPPTGQMAPALVKSVDKPTASRIVQGRGPQGREVERLRGTYGPAPRVKASHGLEGDGTAATVSVTWTWHDALHSAPLDHAGVSSLSRSSPAAPQIHLDLTWRMDTCEGSDGWHGDRSNGCIQLGYLYPGVSIEGLMDTVPMSEGCDDARSRVRLSVAAMTDVVWGQLRFGFGAGATAMRLEQVDGVNSVMLAPLLAARSRYSLQLGEHFSLDLAVATDVAVWPLKQTIDPQVAASHEQAQWLLSGRLGFRWTMQ